MGTDQARSEFDAMCQVFLKKFDAYTPSAQIPGKEEGRRNSEDEQEQGKASQRQVGAMKAPQPVVWSLIFLVFGVHLANAEEQENQAQHGMEKDLCPIVQVDFRWKRMQVDEKYEWKWDERARCFEQKEKRNSQGKDPRTFDGKQPRW